MSQKFPGGFITKSPVAPTTTAASGIWTLDQQEQYQQAGTWPSPPPPPYIEDVFSTYLYTGSSGTVTNTNNIDISGKGGLVWVKNRSAGTTSHMLADTARGGQYTLNTDTTSDQGNQGAYGFTFLSTGFSLPNSFPELNTSGNIYTSWTFRKQPKFFDVVTYTGNATSGRAVAHNLGSIPGCIIVKRTDAALSWQVYHRSLPTNGANGVYNLVLNDTGGQLDNGQFTVAADATNFYVGGFSGTNASGGSYVAYLFAHDAGGFGATETENVISCGSYTDSATVNLGYEPQWIMVKRTNTTGDWVMIDTMRGLNANFSGASAGDAQLFANLSSAELAPPNGDIGINSTGFRWNGSAGTYIYIAIRRGPMKTPTDATKVFSPIATTAATGTTLSTNFPIDMQMWAGRTSSYAATNSFYDRLRGVSTTTSNQNSPFLLAPSTAAEATTYATTQAWSNTGFNIASIFSSLNSIYWNFRRAPSFFDEVCYTGDGTADGRTITHNLGVTPQLVIVKRRSSTSNWVVMFNTDHAVLLNSTNADTGYSDATGNYANGILIGTNATTLTQYSGASGNSACNASGSTYVAYLFATCAGVSKVGSYTGTGTLTTINCGFTGGARYVLIKRTDSTADWYVWDTARGMVSGTDPSIKLNSTAAEVNFDSVYTITTGFQLLASPSADVNASGGSYIYLAIA